MRKSKSPPRRSCLSDKASLKALMQTPVGFFFEELVIDASQSPDCRLNKSATDGFALCPRNRINILGASPRMNPFNNDYFDGRCTRVMNPQTGTHNRLPWNVGSLHYEVGETRSPPKGSNGPTGQPRGSLPVFPDPGGGDGVSGNLRGLAQSSEGDLERDEHERRRWTVLQVHADRAEQFQSVGERGRRPGLLQESDDKASFRTNQHQGKLG